jgi:hypothetical protein
MNKIIKNILILFVVILFLSTIINAFVPFYWGDYTQTTKILHYKENPNKYNALFFGGSLEYRHINPSKVDASLKKQNVHLQSFNMGIDGHNIIQQLRDIDGVLKIENNNLKYIFVSVSSEPYFFKPNRNTAKWISWQNISSYINAIKILPTLQDDWCIKGRFIFYYTTSFFKKIITFGLLPNIFQSYLDRTKLDDAYLGKNKDGFFSYNEEEKLLLQHYKWADEFVLESNIVYKNEKQKRDSLTNSIKKSFEAYTPANKANKAEVNMLLKLIQKCSKKGIDVYFILPPRARTSYDFLLPVYHALPKNRCIELANPNQYPTFYSLQFGYNFHHLNLDGANLYSEKLGEKIGALLKQNISEIQ